MCQSLSLAAIGRVVSPTTSDRYTLYQCGACGSRSFDLHECDTDLAAFYERLALSDAVSPEGAFRRAPLWDREVTVITRLFGRRPRSVLDAGCRAGDFLLHWPPEIRRVGVELSQRSAALARQRGLTVHQGLLEDLDLREQFEVVTCYAILEHLAQPRRFLERLEGLLCPGGLLAVMVPSFETGKARLLEAIGYPWHMNRPPEHLNLYSRGFLDGFFGRRGFALVSRRYTSGGMANPLRRIPGLGQSFARLMWWVDAYTPLNTLPLFDHMYTYYRRKDPGSGPATSR
jgi:SAM-dependent methyltransferase